MTKLWRASDGFMGTRIKVTMSCGHSYNSTQSTAQIGKPTSCSRCPRGTVVTIQSWKRTI